MFGRYAASGRLSVGGPAERRMLRSGWPAAAEEGMGRGAADGGQGRGRGRGRGGLSPPELSGGGRGRGRPGMASEGPVGMGRRRPIADGLGRGRTIPGASGEDSGPGSAQAIRRGLEEIAEASKQDPNIPEEPRKPRRSIFDLMGEIPAAPGRGRGKSISDVPAEPAMPARGEGIVPAHLKEKEEGTRQQGRGQKKSQVREDSTTSERSADAEDKKKPSEEAEKSEARAPETPSFDEALSFTGVFDGLEDETPTISARRMFRKTPPSEEFRPDRAERLSRVEAKKTKMKLKDQMHIEAQDEREPKPSRIRKIDMKAAKQLESTLVSNEEKQKHYDDLMKMKYNAPKKYFPIHEDIEELIPGLPEHHWMRSYLATSIDAINRNQFLSARDRAAFVFNMVRTLKNINERLKRKGIGATKEE